MDEQDKIFITMFPEKKRSLVANQFCGAVRAGAKTSENVLEWVSFDCRKRLEDRYATPESREVQEKLLNMLDTDEAENYANYTLWWETLTPQQKETYRKPLILDYRAAAISRKPVTEPQLGLLRKLGCPTIPQNRLEASQLIEEYLAKEKANGR